MRLACDRCHIRKLRCTQRTPSGPCCRCLQSGETCTYSQPLKPGRRRKSTQNYISSDVPKSEVRSSAKLLGDDGGDNAPSTTSTILSSTNILLPDLVFGSDGYPIYDTEDPDFPSIDYSNLQSPPSSRWLDSLPADPQLARLGEELGNGLGDQRPPSEGIYKESSSGQKPALDCKESNNCIELSQIIQTIGRLHRQLACSRRQSRHESEGAATSVPCRSALSAINDVLAPGKELIDLVCKLCQRCTQDSANDMCFGFIDDRRTVFGLIKAPIHRLLHTYNDILSEIAASATEHCCQLDIIQSHFQFLSAKFAHATPHGNAIETFDLSLGQLNISRSIQLNIILTVLREHIGTLESGLRSHGIYMGGPGMDNVGRSCSLEELSSYTSSLLSLTQIISDSLRL